MFPDSKGVVNCAIVDVLSHAARSIGMIENWWQLGIGLLLDKERLISSTWSKKAAAELDCIEVSLDFAVVIEYNRLILSDTKSAGTFAAWIFVVVVVTKVRVVVITVVSEVRRPLGHPKTRQHELGKHSLG